MSGIVIIGGGLAGARAAHYLREEGYKDALTIVASEPHYPYQRPPLSKRYLRGSETLDDVYANPKEWYENNSVRVITGNAAIDLDTEAHTVTLNDGEKLDYTKLLIATGSRARKLNIEGGDLAGVQYLRTLDDADALAAKIRDGGKKVVLIGSGWIGTEAASSAIRLGNEVSIIEQGSVPLANVMGETLGRAVQKMHEGHGVKFFMNSNVAKIVGENGKVTGVVADGVTHQADVVLIGIGAIPNTELAEKAGIEVDNGILVNSALETSAKDVYAAGDVANVENAAVGARMRSEHWAVARTTGKAAAFSMLGQDVAYNDIPYFYTDQFEFSMELSGYPHLMREAEIVTRGDVPGNKYLAFWVNDQKVVAGMNVGIWDVNDKIQKMIREAKQVDVAKLTDEKVSLDW